MTEPEDLPLSLEEAKRKLKLNISTLSLNCSHDQFAKMTADNMSMIVKQPEAQQEELMAYARTLIEERNQKRSNQVRMN